eukprot:365082-Chlamydomonas_euryale.AAC.6
MPSQTLPPRSLPTSRTLNPTSHFRHPTLSVQSPHNVASIIQLAQRAGLNDGTLHVWITDALAAPSPRALPLPLAPGVRSVRAVPDASRGPDGRWQPLAHPLAALEPLGLGGGTEQYDMYGPSVRLPADEMARLVEAAAGAPLVVWTVDGREELRTALSAGASVVISNHPDRLAAALDGLRGGACGEGGGGEGGGWAAVVSQSSKNV